MSFQGFIWNGQNNMIIMLRSLNVGKSCLQLQWLRIPICWLFWGGPQNPHTTLAECPYFDAQREQTVIKYCIDHHKIVVGTCLGAQLIGESLGFPYEHSPQKEIGMFPITINDDGKQDDVLEDFRPEEELCVWHNDMPGIGDESVILASSAGCPRQIVHYNPLTYGLQCHMEFTNDSIKSMTVHDDTVKDAIQNSDQYQFVESAAELATIDCSRSHELLASLLDHLVLRYDHL